MTWEKAWREGRTGWDAGASPPVLEELVRRGELPAGRALVPGCGAGYDVFTLATEERRVVGLDLAPTAARRFEALREARGVPAERASIVVEDFFAYEPEAPFDVVWDYTFLCAIDPSVRADWARKVESLLAPEGELVTLIFPAVDEPPRGEGPPHPLRPEHVRELLEPRFEAVELRPVDRSHPGREGMEHLGRWRRR
ncbi:MAG TPA: methyltransferase domain-containing protein [Sandaracinaceae bacterium LLY-WYZ-13_1]|nr:methyltransferase domain-containing protein [Sandaracinaceae bacterium LLY-WYZ-13_1]